MVTVWVPISIVVLLLVGLGIYALTRRGKGTDSRRPAIWDGVIYIAIGAGLVLCVGTAFWHLGTGGSHRSTTTESSNRVVHVYDQQGAQIGEYVVNDRAERILVSVNQHGGSLKQIEIWPKTGDYLITTK